MAMDSPAYSSKAMPPSAGTTFSMLLPADTHCMAADAEFSKSMSGYFLLSLATAP